MRDEIFQRHNLQWNEEIALGIIYMVLILFGIVPKWVGID